MDLLMLMQTEIVLMQNGQRPKFPGDCPVNLYFLPSVGQFLGDILPGDSFFSHQHHAVIQEIRDLIFDLFRIGIFRCNDDLCTLFSHFFQDLVNALFKKIIRVRAFLRMKLPVFDDCIDIFQYLQRIDMGSLLSTSVR